VSKQAVLEQKKAERIAKDVLVVIRRAKYAGATHEELVRACGYVGSFHAIPPAELPKVIDDSIALLRTGQRIREHPEADLAMRKGQTVWTTRDA
jgi:hypothetical protein